MKSTDFLKLEIDNLVMANPALRCRYEFDVHSCIHLIEVTPFSVYELDEKYIEFESKITFSFIDNFPNENICFISDDSLVKISNPSYTKIGLLFATINWIPLLEQTFEQIIPVQKIPSFHRQERLTFVFWDENTNKNISNTEQTTLANTYTFQMAA